MYSTQCIILSTIQRLWWVWREPSTRSQRVSLKSVLLWKFLRSYAQLHSHLPLAFQLLMELQASVAQIMVLKFVVCHNEHYIGWVGASPPTCSLCNNCNFSLYRVPGVSEYENIYVLHYQLNFKFKGQSLQLQNIAACLSSLYTCRVHVLGHQWCQLSRIKQPSLPVNGTIACWAAFYTDIDSLYHLGYTRGVYISLHGTTNETRCASLLIYCLQRWVLRTSDTTALL